MTMIKNITPVLKATLMLFVAFSSNYAFAQGSTTVNGQVNEGRIPTPTMLFLAISPDARAAAMGDAGVASANDVYSLYWNPAKIAVAEKNLGVGISYTPWLRNLVPDMALYNLAGYKKIDKNQAFGLVVNYFDQGLFQATLENGTPNGNYNSKEYSISGTYARKLSEKLSLGVTVKYLNSNLLGNYQGNGGQGVATKPASTVAADVSIFYNSKRDKPWNYTYGAMISNISGQVSYGGVEKNFIPTNLKLGAAAIRTLDAHSKLLLTVDLNKMMVPTPPLRDASGKVVKGTDPANVTALSGIFGSFGDAPDGFGEEIKEFTMSFGAEYVYNDMFAIRTGYFNESQMKGNRKYVTAGVGFKLEKKYAIDFAYLFPTSGGSPLANTLRLTLSANLDSAPKATPGSDLK
jgi:Type IX secretion system protein PorV